ASQWRSGDYRAGAMREALRHLWEARSREERVMAVMLAIVLAAALYCWLWQSADRARDRLSTSVTLLRAQAARLDQQAAEHERLRAQPAATASATDLRALVQAQAGASGLSRSLQRIDAPDPGQVQVVFGAVAFGDWLAWVSGLAAQQ